ncbi:EF-hand domain-containing protein [Mesobacterium sp. TK19101]|uniref:EF-hand domain-containing protein n=1 Tax=Mesobacterium hydrothermale TaxID=3111907 RepID=A0ABU6HK35_9RHOB|nr:EF-hand domain-containing protein [Mesobacterium sp. TK19101]MEC3861515.1 EF-hand domain-containing protein [Mesobacterium sp. TK19101]
MKSTLIALPLVLATASFAAAQGNPAATKFMENWDLNSDGVVTVEEATEMRNNVFYSFDSDENGVIDDEEHVMFDEARANDIAEMPKGPGRALIQMIADGMSKEANDANGDGTVTGPEFEAGAANWLATVDKNGDGVVTIADFAM